MVKSQNARIVAYLETGKSLTPLAALDRFGCLRLAARIQDLRRAGHPIESQIVRLGNKRFASYRLA